MFYQNFNFHSKVTKIKLSFIFKNVLNPPHFQKQSDMTLNVLSGSYSPDDNSNDTCYCSHKLSMLPMSFRYKSILNIYYFNRFVYSRFRQNNCNTVYSAFHNTVKESNIIIEIQHVKLTKKCTKTSVIASLYFCKTLL